MDTRKVKYGMNLSNKERKMILYVLQKYGIEPLEILKARSAYKITTNENNYCLKRMNHGKYKAFNVSTLTDYLFREGFKNTAKFIYTKTGDRYLRYKHMFFYVTEWIDGQECDLNNINEAAECCKILAQFHVVCENIDSKNLKINDNSKNWFKLFNKHLYDIQGYKKIIEEKKLKNEFDIVYYKYIDSFYNRGLIALKYLNLSHYNKKITKNPLIRTICHNSFYYQNIIKKNNEYYLIDLDRIGVDLRIYDLGKFIRRLMFKKEYKWDFNKAKDLIDGYNSISKLSKEELEVMIALIIFPHKFWKLGRKRYVKHKRWSEYKYTHKLNKIILYDDYQNKFIEEYNRYNDKLND